jgi:hypothetical protein
MLLLWGRGMNMRAMFSKATKETFQSLGPTQGFTLLINTEKVPSPPDSKRSA